MKIESKENQKIKNLKKLRDKKNERYDARLFYVEGERIIKNIDSSLIEEIYIDENYDGYLPKIDKNKIIDVTNNIFNDIKDTVTTQGIIAIVKFPNINIDKNDTTPIIILDNIQDPGNVGTIIRTCEAAGVKNIYILDGTADPYSPKAIRSSMSSITRLNIKISDNSNDLIDELKKDGYKIYGTFLDNSTCIYEEDYPEKIAIVFGNEGNGISKNIENLCDARIKIPMDGKIESLNVSQASAIVMYEIKRKRHIK